MSTHFTFQYFVAVEPLVLITPTKRPPADLIRAGFARAELPETCLADVAAELEANGMDAASRMRLLTMNATFQEFDSGNWTHANACFLVTIAARDEGVEIVRKAFAESLVEDES